MRKTELSPGSRIELIDGFLIVKNCNDAGLYDIDEYIADDYGGCIFDECIRLTGPEIARRMKEVDGLNHKVVWIG